MSKTIKLGQNTIDEAPPMLSLSSRLLPDLKNWKPGGRYRVTLDLEQTNMSIGGYGPLNGNKPDDTVHASFVIKSARPQYSGKFKGRQNGGKPDKGATMDALKRKAQGY